MKRRSNPDAAGEKQFLEEMSHALAGWSDPTAHLRNVLKTAPALSKLNAILRVGEVIGVDVIAECVEEQGILVRLKALGVGYAQGFGIYQPHAIEKIATRAPSRPHIF